MAQLALQDPQAVQAQQVPLAHRAYKAAKETPDLLVQMEQLEPLARKA
jgi:hypothetical protein